MEIDAGSTMLELAEEHFALYCQYRRPWADYMALKRKSRGPQDPLVVHYWWGDTGTGKTTRAYNDYPTAYWHISGTKWFDGYDPDNDKCVIFDDYDTAAFTCRQFLTILQSFPRKVEVKGGTLDFKPETIVITNNVSPDMLYAADDPRLIAAFIRRLTSVVHFE